ncbi:MAG: hypothetical protein Q4F38_00965 [Akkermansia sp.]|nr:hypothetical protein [Akkermansia sp.]
MKKITYLLLLGLFANVSPLIAQDEASPETTEETAAEPKVDEKAMKKAASRYWSTKMARLKKSISYVKKVKDKKSSKKMARAIEKLCARELVKPEDSDIMAAAERRYAPHIEKLLEQLDEELERIEGGSGGGYGYGGSSERLMTEELKAALDKVRK